MRLTLEAPTRLYIDDISPKTVSEIRESLTYTDKTVQFTLQKFKKNRYLFNRLGPERYQEQLDEMKSKLKVCLLEQEADGRYWVLSGFRSYLENKYGVSTTVNVVYEEPNSIAWAVKPTKVPYPYQRGIIKNLDEAKHARIEAGTGLGKTVSIMYLVRELGLKTVIMTPSTSISEQIYDEFSKAFGKGKVGAFFDGKKEFKKLITVANAQSLTKIEEGTEAWNALKKTQVYVVDESHLVAASTFKKVCTGVMTNVPRRFFFSATQMRGDGKDLLLEGITGETVYSMTVREGVDQGYLAKPIFHMIETVSDEYCESDDTNEMTRAHLYYNKNVNKQAAEIINHSVENLGHQVLVLVDEVSQFAQLASLLRHKVEFAHGPLTKTTFHPNGKVKVQGNKEYVPQEHWDSDPNDLVRKFNNGEIPILVGTSCVSIGTDTRNAKTLVYLKGGKSEVEVRQGIGRGTRLIPTKTACLVFDFDVVNIPVLHKHASIREDIYNDIYPHVKRINWTERRA